MGWNDLRNVASHAAVEIAALCDVDKNQLENASDTFDEAKKFKDWREMFDTMGSGFDAVIVSTPDHMHAPISMTALMENKSVYCQKPLTHTIYESRRLRDVAIRKPVVATQMGTQNASRISKRQALSMLRDGIIGELTEIHAWSDRPAGWWPQGKDRPAGSDPVPSYLDWDLWIGVAPMRDYKRDTYAPFKWRGFRDFGCGALGDMACHICDTPIQAFKLYKPTSVVVEATDATEDMFPSTERVIFEMAGVDASGGKTVKFSWTDGGRVPKHSELNIDEDFNLGQNTVAVVGSKATLLVNRTVIPRRCSWTASSRTSRFPTCRSRTTGTSGSTPRSADHRPSRTSASRDACARSSRSVRSPRASRTRSSPTTHAR